ncbi:MAG: hypothetical protein GTO62_18935 [Planctomycetales bacterium]|nr:hypothetical protein [Planctomycetales bacterium]
MRQVFEGLEPGRQIGRGTRHDNLAGYKRRLALLGEAGEWLDDDDQDENPEWLEKAGKFHST